MFGLVWFVMLIARHDLSLTAWLCGDRYTSGFSDVKFDISVGKIALRKSQCYFCQAAVKTAQDLFWLGGNYVVNDR